MGYWYDGSEVEKRETALKYRYLTGYLRVKFNDHETILVCIIMCASCDTNDLTTFFLVTGGTVMKAMCSKHVDGKTNLQATECFF